MSGTLCFDRGALLACRYVETPQAQPERGVQSVFRLV